MIYLATGRVAYTGFGLAALRWSGRRSSTRSCRASRTAFDNWLHPFGDAQGQGYQLVQSLYALAEGGVVGPGPGQGASW